jgi:hypothetical protein
MRCRSLTSPQRGDSHRSVFHPWSYSLVIIRASPNPKFVKSSLILQVRQSISFESFFVDLLTSSTLNIFALGIQLSYYSPPHLFFFFKSRPSTCPHATSKVHANRGFQFLLSSGTPARIGLGNVGTPLPKRGVRGKEGIAEPSMRVKTAGARKGSRRALCW